MNTLVLEDKFAKPFYSERDLHDMLPAVREAVTKVQEYSGAGSDFLGWQSLPEDYDKEEFSRIQKAAAKIQKTCDVFVVIGIGGSYLGARAVIEYLKSPRYNQLKKDTPEIYFAGDNISGSDLSEILTLCEGKDVCVNVISKSGTTTEPAIAFRVFRGLLEQKYGKDGAKDRIFVTTDKCRGTLKAFSTDAGYETFVVPDNVGGRYSVLTAVGLLPIAVAGIDIPALMQGAKDAMTELNTVPDAAFSNPAYKYAALRNLFLRRGKNIEILVDYEPYAVMFNEWWKQLYGESEGKDGRGLFPASVNFSTDLHSLGQYIQQGQRTMFETVLQVVTPDNGTSVPHDPANIDGLNFLSGKTMAEVNTVAMQGTLLAHVDGGVPNIVLQVADRSAHTLGYMIYFFELACAVSGYLLGVNPFNQPGVEAYKKNMFALLGKPGYEEMTAALQSRLK